MPQLFVGDKVMHKDLELPGEVVKVGKIVNWPGKGSVRKVWWKGVGRKTVHPWEWNWDFELEAW